MRLGNALHHVLDHLASGLRQGVGGLCRNEGAALVAKQLAAQAGLQRMQRAVHAHRRGAQQIGRFREIARLHEGQQHLEFAKGDFVVDTRFHASPIPCEISNCGPGAGLQSKGFMHGFSTAQHAGLIQFSRK